MSGRRLVPVVLLLAAGGVSACESGGSSPLEPTPTVAFATAISIGTGSNSNQQGQWGGTNKESCSPLPPISSHASIGRAGGTLRIGPNTLTVPAGALTTTVTITGSITADSVSSVQFLPQGLQFVVPATLTLSYRNCRHSDDQTKTMKVAYTSDNLALLLALLPSTDQKSSKTVSGMVSHFSRYAVAY